VQKNRKDEQGVRLPIRTDRFFVVNSSWFFTTREGTSIGPYTTKEEAYNGLIDFIDFIEKAEPMLLRRFIDTLTDPSYAERSKAD